MRKYYTVFTLSITQSLKNYKSLMGLSIFLMVCLMIFSQLWKVVAAKIGAIDLQAKDLLWYIAFNEWIYISLPDVQEDIETDLRSGSLAYLLPRPISYLGSTFCGALGTFLTHLMILGLVAFLFTTILAGGPPCSLASFLIMIGIGILAGVVGIIFQMLIGISAFWIEEVGPFYWLWEKSLFALGGLMLPLSVYPIWLQNIAHYTPFPAFLGDRSALVINFSSTAALNVVNTLLIWGFLGFLTLVLSYRKGLRTLSIEGG